MESWSPHTIPPPSERQSTSAHPDAEIELAIFTLPSTVKEDPVLRSARVDTLSPNELVLATEKNDPVTSRPLDDSASPTVQGDRIDI